MQLFGKKPTFFSGKNKGRSASDRQERLASQPDYLFKKNHPKKLNIVSGAGH
jgi:major membrane immunogen (membrane-anchored lipoprotein)